MTSLLYGRLFQSMHFMQKYIIYYISAVKNIKRIKAVAKTKKSP